MSETLPSGGRGMISVCLLHMYLTIVLSVIEVCIPCIPLSYTSVLVREATLVFTLLRC